MNANDLTKQLTNTLKNDRRIPIYSHFKSWYSDCRLAIHEYVRWNYPTGDFYVRVNQLTALLAITSPRVHVKRNVALALEVLSDIVNVSNFKYRSVDDVAKLYKIMPRTAENLLHWGRTGEIRGPKVLAFYHNLSGNEEPVTIDVWVMRYFGFTQESPNVTQRKAITDAITKASKQYKMTPAQLQAVVWAIAVTEANRTMTSFADFLRVED